MDLFSLVLFWSVLFIWATNRSMNQKYCSKRIGWIFYPLFPIRSIKYGVSSGILNRIMFLFPKAGTQNGNNWFLILFFQDFLTVQHVFNVIRKIKLENMFVFFWKKRRYHKTNHLSVTFAPSGPLILFLPISRFQLIFRPSYFWMFCLFW